MKYLITLSVLFLTIFTHGQSFTTLVEPNNNDSIQAEVAIIYGSFIQRLGFSSGGFPQDIRLINIETQEILTFRVKPTFKSAKKNTFIYFIKPGHYAILNYWWTKSTVYGGKNYTEPIFKNFDATKNLNEKMEDETKEELQQFTFEITKSSLNYLGTWHFDKEIVSFTDDKKEFDISVKNKYSKIDFSSAKTILPN